ncbi:MAG: hypothetical protein DDT37_01820 [Firmicutes bacterium]|nr:hypothetical protein [candidate division NPL-UPA2 bacterium]
MKQQELPKGMSFPDEPNIELPVTFTLGRGNYIASIYQALEKLPIEIRVDKCVVLEAHGMPPEVRLTLRILGGKEEGK